MPTITATSTDPARLRVDTLVVGCAPGPRGAVRLLPGAGPLDAALGGRLATVLRQLGATGRLDQVTRLATLGAAAAPAVLAVGVGGADPADPETLRRAAGRGVRALAGTRRAGVLLVPPDRPDLVGPVAEGALLGGYAFRRFLSGDDGLHSAPVEALSVVVPDAKGAGVATALEAAREVAAAVALCRDLVNTPAMELHPADLAAAAEQACAPLGLSVDVLDEEALREGGYGGIIGVGSGSSHPPRLVRIGYVAGRGRPTLALVGKGITFDSGGLSLKPLDGMKTMKCDMGGAAAVIATMVAVARLRPGINVTGWVPTAENMPSGTAIRPGDVLRIRGGRTVEVLNTDAEGRLILADAIVRAGEEQPDAIVDVATLTGAQVVALGGRTFGVMGNDDELRDRVLAAAAAAGEPAWPMPLPDYLRRSLDSTVADIANVTADREAGMLVAGVFLRDFVPAGVRWAHLDIAGPAFNAGESFGYTPRGGTGAAVRTLVRLAIGLGAG